MKKSKKIFLAHKFTGEDIKELTEFLSKILTALRSVGHTVYCSFEDEKGILKITIPISKF